MLRLAHFKVEYVHYIIIRKLNYLMENYIFHIFLSLQYPLSVNCSCSAQTQMLLGFPQREKATYICPLVQTLFGSKIPHFAADCPWAWALSIINANVTFKRNWFPVSPNWNCLPPYLIGILGSISTLFSLSSCASSLCNTDLNCPTYMLVTVSAFDIHIPEKIHNSVYYQIEFIFRQSRRLRVFKYSVGNIVASSRSRSSTVSTLVKQWRSSGILSTISLFTSLIIWFVVARSTLDWKQLYSEFPILTPKSSQMSSITYLIFGLSKHIMWNFGGGAGRQGLWQQRQQHV